MQSRHFFKLLHIYLGWILFIPLLFIILTGMMLSGRDSIRSSKQPYQLKNPVSWDVRFLEGALQHLDQMGIKEKIDSIYLPAASDQSLRIETSDETGLSGQRFFIQPENSVILAQTSLKNEDLFDWAYQFHRGTWGGSQNKAIMSLLGLFIALLWPLGWLYRKFEAQRHSNSLTLRTLKNPILLHRCLGYFLGSALTLMTLSGSMLNYKKNLFQAFDPIPTSAPASSSEPPSRRRVDSITPETLAFIEKAHPEAPIESIHLQSAPAPFVLFYLKDDSRVYFNAKSLQIEKVMTPQKHWIHALFPIHSGRIWGRARIIVILLAGLSFLGITLTGVRATRRASHKFRAASVHF